MPYRVLAIDGGGIRGTVPAVLLDRLETLAGRPIRDLFDLIVGTSTGGILTLGLTTPDGDGHPRYRAAELLRLYLDDGPRIFRRPAGHRIRTANALLGPRYPADGLEQVLTREFGEVRLRDLLGDVLVPAYETEIREPWFFRSRRARASDGYDFLARDVARATSAAPVHFLPARVTGGDGSGWTLIDGGIYANNPAMCGVVEAMAVHGADDVVTLSLGTGLDSPGPCPTNASAAGACSAGPGRSSTSCSTGSATRPTSRSRSWHARPTRWPGTCGCSSSWPPTTRPSTTRARRTCSGCTSGRCGSRTTAARTSRRCCPCSRAERCSVGRRAVARLGPRGDERLLADPRTERRQAGLEDRQPGVEVGEPFEPGRVELVGVEDEDVPGRAGHERPSHRTEGATQA